jgi:N-glycosylase/DNA lyase
MLKDLPVSSMNIRLGRLSPFNLDFTLCCGQAFRWDKHREWWYGVVGEKVFKLRQKGCQLEFENVGEEFVVHYVGLKDDLPGIYVDIERDEHIQAAIRQFKGLRILRQDPWECLISYICATYKNVEAIKLMLLNLARKYGERKSLDSLDFYTFPTQEKLAKAHLEGLASCGVGYRARYVSETAKKVHENCFEFDRLRKASYEKAKNELLSFAGVGPKVADCVLLFSLGKLEAFPVDVWMRRVILRYYRPHFSKEFINRVQEGRSLSDSEYSELNLFGRGYFGKYAGYAQEYLYHRERMKSKDYGDNASLLETTGKQKTFK